MSEPATATRTARIIIEDPFVVCPHCGNPMPFEGDIKVTDSTYLICKNPACGEKLTLLIICQVVDLLYFESNAPFLVQLAQQTEAYRKLGANKQQNGGQE